MHRISPANNACGKLVAAHGESAVSRWQVGVLARGADSHLTMESCGRRILIVTISSCIESSACKRVYYFVLALTSEPSHAWTTGHQFRPQALHPARAVPTSSSEAQPPTSRAQSNPFRPTLSTPHLYTQHNLHDARPPHRYSRLERAARFPQRRRPPLDFRHWREGPRGPCRQRLQPREGRC